MDRPPENPSVVAPRANSLSRGQRATLAIVMETCAPKPGNVHRGADFDDVTFFDFAAAAVAIAPPFDAITPQTRLGTLVYEAVAATRNAVGSNTNLGTLLLLGPLALVQEGEAVADGIERVLAGLDAEDAQQIYAAIRLAQPGGMGRVEEHDVADSPPAELLRAMQAAAERDLVARQYVNQFDQVLHDVVPLLAHGLSRGWGLADVIVRTHLEMMSRHPDSLIGRKCGPAVAKESARRAQRVLQAGLPGEEDYATALADLDFWLRSDHHRRNPGTTADLIAAGLFAALGEGIIEQPYLWTTR